jgi:hypothetical protein
MLMARAKARASPARSRSIQGWSSCFKLFSVKQSGKDGKRGGRRSLNVSASYGRPLSGTVLPDGRFHANQATKHPNDSHITRMINMRQAELNGAGTKPNVQATENLHCKKEFRTEKMKPVRPHVNTP